MATEHTEHAVTTAGEGHAETGVFPPFDQTNFVPVLIWLVLTFGALYLLMSKVALPRVEGILKQRSSKIHGDIGEANKLRKEADSAAQAYEKTLAEAKGRSQSLAQETRAKLNAESEARSKSVEADLNAKLAAAEAQIADTKAKAMTNVADIARETAAAIVEHLTGKPADSTAIAAAVAAAKS